MGATVTRLPPKKKEQLTKELREVRARVRGQLFYTMNLEPQSYSLDTIDEISSRDNISDGTSTQNPGIGYPCKYPQ